MIPKIIHYCWFGGKELPELARKCIDSWKRLLPEYQIKEWNESNFDITCNEYVREAYEAKKYAFVSDYVRLWAIYSYGGIYMDTDVEVVKKLDSYLEHSAFTGFESPTKAVTGIIGCESGNRIIGELLEYYANRHFLLENGSFDTTTNTVIITRHFMSHGIKLNNLYQEIGGG